MLVYINILKISYASTYILCNVFTLIKRLLLFEEHFNSVKCLIFQRDILEYEHTYNI